MPPWQAREVAYYLESFLEVAMRQNLLRFCWLFAALALFSGCAATNSGSTAAAAKPKAGRFMVGVKKSPFYKYGPAQAFGPDFALPQGQRLTLIEQSFGFSRVMTDDGVSGYMPTEDLIPAGAEPAPTPAAPRLASRGRTRGGSDDFYSGPVRKSRPIERMDDAPPLFDVFDETPLPTDPEQPQTDAKDKPKFRANRLP